MTWTTHLRLKIKSKGKNTNCQLQDRNTSGGKCISTQRHPISQTCQNQFYASKTRFCLSQNWSQTSTCTSLSHWHVHLTAASSYPKCGLASTIVDRCHLPIVLNCPRWSLAIAMSQIDMSFLSSNGSRYCFFTNDRYSCFFTNDLQLNLSCKWVI